MEKIVAQLAGNMPVWAHLLDVVACTVMAFIAGLYADRIVLWVKSLERR